MKYFLLCLTSFSLLPMIAELPVPILEHAHSKLPISLGSEEQTWPERGTLEFVFEFPDIESTLALAPAMEEGYLHAALFQLPFVKSNYWSYYKEQGLHGGGGLALLMPDKDGKEKRLQMAMSRMDGKKPYHLVMTWDLPAKEVALYLQGTRQGDLSHWGADSPDIADPGRGPARFGGDVRQGKQIFSPVQVHQVRIFDEVLDPQQIQEAADRLKLPPLSGEGRTVYTGSLKLDELKRKEIFRTDFQGELSWEHEEGLIEAEKRVKRPQAEWVLEGPHASLSSVEGGIKLSSAEPEDRKHGHMVLWLNKEMPADFLLEYRFSPENDRKGLGIVFFNARNPHGETLFDLDLPIRRGIFGEYIIGKIDSYHVSSFAADDKNLRRTANMRKNSGFMLVSVGNDRIGGSGPGPHTVRVLKRGGKVQVESNGVIALEYQDDGKAHGPVHDHPGLIGIRFMAHSRSAILHSLKVWELE